jgi:hypothetical protein
MMRSGCVIAAVSLVIAACAGDDPTAMPTAPLESRSATSVDSTSDSNPDSTVEPTVESESSAVAASIAPSSTLAATIDPGAPPARLDGDLVDGWDAVEFAAALSSTHATMTDASATSAERASAGIEYQLVSRELADRPDLDEAVLTAVDPAAGVAVQPTVRARQFLQARSAARPPQPLPDDVPAWTIVEPEPIDTLLAHYAEAEALTGIAWYWLAAIHLQETRMGRIQGVSSAGAVGPMQFLPTTWAECCVGDPVVTRDAIIGAATYLAQSGGPADMAAAVYQYNPNDGYVAVVTAYAETLREQPELYHGYHAFQVFFGSSVGTIRLPIGFSQPAPIDAATYLADHPDDAA